MPQCSLGMWVLGCKKKSVFDCWTGALETIYAWVGTWGWRERKSWWPQGCRRWWLCSHPEESFQTFQNRFYSQGIITSINIVFTGEPSYSCLKELWDSEQKHKCFSVMGCRDWEQTPNVKSTQCPWTSMNISVIKHCQRHNGPEGWVHLDKLTSWSHITSTNTNLDHISSSESRLSIN